MRPSCCSRSRRGTASSCRRRRPRACAASTRSTASSSSSRAGSRRAGRCAGPTTSARSSSTTRAARKKQGCVYIEAICSPTEPVLRGSSWEEVFEGYCDGAAEAREPHGVEVRLTPDITRDFPAALGNRLARRAVQYRERGVVALSMGGSEKQARAAEVPQGVRHRPRGRARLGAARRRVRRRQGRRRLDPRRPRRAARRPHPPRHPRRRRPGAARRARGAGRRLRRHAGEQPAHRRGRVARRAPAAGHARRRRELLDLLRRPRAHAHRPGRELRRRGALGHTPQAMYFDALHGALCDAATRAKLRRIGEDFDWETRRELRARAAAVRSVSGRRQPVWLAFGKGTCYCPNRNQWSRFSSRPRRGWLPPRSRPPGPCETPGSVLNERNAVRTPFGRPDDGPLPGEPAADARASQHGPHSRSATRRVTLPGSPRKRVTA